MGSPSFFPAAGLEVVFRSPGNLQARFGNVLLQIRTGKLTLEMLDAIERGARLTRASSTRGKVGAIVIVDEGAELGDAAARKRQRELLREMLADKRSYVAVVVYGDGIRAPLIRTVTRMLTRGIDRLHWSDTPEDAIRWLCRELGNIDPGDLGKAVEEARALARSGSD